MSIIYKKGSLFEAPKDSILVHSCNSRGVWGKGIAAEFKRRFPESFEFYKEFCDEEKDNLLSLTLLCPEENDYVVGCLMVSKGYGKFKDSKAEILVSTRLALPCVLRENRSIHSCKFNSGLFGVPWEETEKILKEAMEEIKYTGTWTIWEL